MLSAELVENTRFAVVIQAQTSMLAMGRPIWSLNSGAVSESNNYSDEHVAVRIREQSKGLKTVSNPEFTSYSGIPLRSPVCSTPFHHFSLMIPLSIYVRVAAKSHIRTQLNLSCQGVEEEEIASNFETTTRDGICAN